VPLLRPCAILVPAAALVLWARRTYLVLSNEGNGPKISQRTQENGKQSEHSMGVLTLGAIAEFPWNTPSAVKKPLTIKTSTTFSSPDCVLPNKNARLSVFRRKP